MTISKLTLPAKDNVVQSKVNDIIDELGNKLENIATGSYSITIGSNPNAGQFGVNVGYSASGTSYSAAFGSYTEASNSYSTAIGTSAVSTANSAIQIGKGTNSSANTLSIGFNNANANYELLDGTTGLIPDARISTNIARTSQIPTVPTNISSFTNDSGYITGITSTDVTTALGYTPYNSSNPSGYTSNVGTVTSVNNTSPDANGNVTISIPSISNLADKDLGNLSATGQAVIDGKADINLGNITPSASAKSEIVSWGVPDYGNQIIGSYPSGGSWVRVTKDSFVFIWGTDSYAENYSVYVSPDNGTTLFAVGVRTDDLDGYTQTTSFTFFVPKNWYFLCQAEGGGEYRIYPLKGA